MKSGSILLFFLSFFFIAQSSCDFQLSGKNQTEEPQSSFVFYRVKKVVDGDTFWISDGSRKGRKIRLLGIDAPESRKTGRKEIGYYGAEAKAYLKQRLLGQQVRLTYDVQRYDKYHRTLAYAYLQDGTFLNEELLKEGYAAVLTIPPNVKYADLLLKAQKLARKYRRGLWNH